MKFVDVWDVAFRLGQGTHNDIGYHTQLQNFVIQFSIIF
tara:strand:- start:9104 stop:9220 length:117 start_codon:yes stop_codon:yes gene_type:complete